MGQGLGIEPTGTYVIYAAGTGILPFMDLLGHLILTFNSPEILSSHKIDPDSFKLVLFASFLNEKEALGTEIIKAL